MKQLSCQLYAVVLSVGVICGNVLADVYPAEQDYLPLYGQLDWAGLPQDIADIERIEVARDPSAASYGSNSVQGVINILMRRASVVLNPQMSISKGDAGKRRSYLTATMEF